jgi:cell shape-determining protein MreC
MKDDVRENDEVVTSIESVFPPGYPIGRVVAVHHDTGGVWQTADVEPAVDVFSLDEIFVLRQAVTPMEELMGDPRAELPLSVAPMMPDTRTIQDRFAP